jgi:hypothetical protein
MNFSKETLRLMEEMRRNEEKLPPCDKCGKRLTFYSSQPGVECRPCERIWLWSWNTGKSIECAWQHHTSPSGMKMSMLLPIEKDKPTE